MNENIEQIPQYNTFDEMYEEYLNIEEQIKILKQFMDGIESKLNGIETIRTSIKNKESDPEEKEGLVDKYKNQIVTLMDNIQNNIELMKQLEEKQFKMGLTIYKMVFKDNN